MKSLSLYACLHAIFYLLIPALTAAQRSDVQKSNETDWQPSLADGGVPECPDHAGQRTLRSEIISDQGVRAYIVGTAVRTQDKTCSGKAYLVLTDGIERKLLLPGPADNGLSLVDFAPDGRSLLFASNGGMDPARQDFRSVSIAIIPLAQGGVSLVNTWDLFRWGDCDAWVEPQGFTNDGKILLSARPPNPIYPGRRACVSEQALYAANPAGPAVRLSNDTKVPRFGKAITDQEQACKTDPDIIGACFTVHGRLSPWNGSPSIRIWRIGTKRILGDHLEWPLPEDLSAHMDFGVEAWGDFEVCPFTKDRPGEMQMICIESASHVLYKTP